MSGPNRVRLDQAVRQAATGVIITMLLMIPVAAAVLGAASAAIGGARSAAGDTDRGVKDMAGDRKEAKMEATWKPHEKHGTLTKHGDLPDSVFAFPRQRKEPLTDAAHVRNAIARFDQVIDVSDEDRALAFANLKKAAEYYGIDMSETDWTQLGRTPHTGRTAEDRRESARKAAATRKKHEAPEQ